MDLLKFNSLWSEIPKISWNDLLFQLIKDFQRAGIDASDLESLTAVPSFELVKLKQQLVSNLENLIQASSEQFWQLIYIVDLPEPIVMELNKEQLEKNLDLLAQLILVREWQKTEFRRRFS